MDNFMSICQIGDLSFYKKLANNAEKIQTTDPFPFRNWSFLQLKYNDLIVLLIYLSFNTIMRTLLLLEICKELLFL